MEWVIRLLHPWPFGVISGPVLGPSSVPIDWPSLLERFGLPLTMLGIMLLSGARRMWVWGWQFKESQEHIAALEASLKAKDDENRGLRDAQLQREQQLVAGLAPRVYDAALLYREGMERAAQSPAPATPALGAGPAAPSYAELAALVERFAGQLDKLTAADPDARGGG